MFDRIYYQVLGFLIIEKLWINDLISFAIGNLVTHYGSL